MRDSAKTDDLTSPADNPTVSGTRRFLSPLSRVGLLLAILCFAAALTPSMIPRPPLMQGLMAGIAATMGYALGAALQTVWHYLEFRPLRGRALRLTTIVLGVVCVAFAIFCLWHAVGWQNSIRSRMSMAPLDSAKLWLVCLAALACFFILIAIGRCVIQLARFLIRRVERRLPRRAATLFGSIIALTLVWVLANGVLAQGLFPLLDASFRQYDALLEPEYSKPTRADRSGSEDSLLSWQSLGRTGRQFISSGPGAQDIQALSGRPAMEPIRTYVGLQSSDSVTERAQLALAELKRAGGFDRSMLVIITPTGTGWVDPAAINAIEYLQNGDIASVAMQYSYLSSPLSLTVHPEYGMDSSRALFSEIYNYWSSLPRDERPRLYLHGLSLGAMNSARSFELFELLGDPIDGALWSGPPFASLTWQRVTQERAPGTPEWLPEFRDNRLFRFMNQNGSPVPADAPWGRVRFVYLQYASDAITFFNPHTFYRSPDWLKNPRGPDVSPALRWYPVVSFVQLAFDMFLSTETPLGYGHVYAPEHYINGWVSVAGAPDWTPEALTQLKTYLGEQARQEIAEKESVSNPYETRGG
ncbi:MAG: alpha/beta hydrolase [Halomonas sp.]|uniref:alpha/beta hydrolase n=1 Tax=Halomonas sp. TaxID=1486246 RepID=UPI003F923ECE